MSNQASNLGSKQLSNQKTRKKLITIILWFFIPLAAAMIWYKVLPARFHPVSATNNGQLLDPIFTLAPFSHPSNSGDVFGNKELEKVWTLVHAVTGVCDEGCSKSLYKTRQLRISMGKDIDRLNRIVVLSVKSSDDLQQKMWASHPDLKILLSAENGIIAQIKDKVKTIEYGKDSLFLVDPLGNVMMHFSADLEPKLIKKDIRKLLKLSRIG